MTDILSVIEEKLKEKLTTNSVKLYMNILKRIKEEVSPKSNTINYLYKVDKNVEFLKSHYSSNSLRTYLGYLVGTLEILDSSAKQKLKHSKAKIKYKVFLKQTGVPKAKKPKLVALAPIVEQVAELQTAENALSL